MPSTFDAFPGFSHIYSARESGGSRAFRASLQVDDELPFFMGEARRDRPIRAHWFMGAARPSDIIWTGFAGWFPRRRGLYFDPATWDGSDIFVAEGTGYKFMVEPVKRALVRAKAKNIEFTRLDQVERSVSYEDEDPDPDEDED